VANQKLKIKMQNYNSKFKNEPARRTAGMCDEAVIMSSIIGWTCAFALKTWPKKIRPDVLSCDMTRTKKI